MVCRPRLHSISVTFWCTVWVLSFLCIKLSRRASRLQGLGFGGFELTVAIPLRSFLFISTRNLWMSLQNRHLFSQTFAAGFENRISMFCYMYICVHYIEIAVGGGFIIVAGR